MRSSGLEGLIARLRELADIQPGWMGNGEGKVPDKLAYTSFCLGLVAAVRDGVITPPYVYPTPEGGLSLEWHTMPWDPSCEANLENNTMYLHTVNHDTKEDDDYEGPLDWHKVKEFLDREEKSYPISLPPPIVTLNGGLVMYDPSVDDHYSDLELSDSTIEGYL